MTKEEFLKQEFITLREEIKETKRRMFLVVVLGTVLVLVASFVGDLGDAFARAGDAGRTASASYAESQAVDSFFSGEVARSSPSLLGALGVAAVPFVVLLLILLYVAEQNVILRCGRYIKEHVEPRIEDTIGWERWLESQRGLRGTDKAFLATFLVIFLIYYFLSVGVAANALASAFGQNWSVQMATLSLLPYVAGGLWALIIALRHWHHMTRTT